MTDDLPSQPGAVATRPEDQEADSSAEEVVFSPRDFRLNLNARLAAPAEPLTTREHPSIRKLTWEHVVPERSEEPAPTPASTVPLPPPPPIPPPPVKSFEPPAASVAPVPSVEIAVVVETPAVVVAPAVMEAPAAVETPEAVEAPALDDVDDDPALEADELDDSVPVVSAGSSGAINRLGSVPDLVIDDSPIELPPIHASGGPFVAQSSPVYAPVLPDTVFATTARPITSNVAALIAENAPTRQQSRRKSRRHPFRTFVSFIVLCGLLGGGAYAAKKYLLKKNQVPTWSAELEPLATDVVSARGLQFKSSVEVQSLTAEVYAGRLAGSVITAEPGRAEAWRALGLVNGDLDLNAIGRQAMNDAPAFYDPATKTIYISDDLKGYEHLYRFAMRRALTTALLDQQFDWSTRLAAATPAVALGLRATIDGDALAVANALAERDTPDQLAPELFSFVQGHGNAVSPSQYAATLIGRAGVVMRPTISAMVNSQDVLGALEQATPGNDVAFDAARLPGSVNSPLNSQGMIFWYYVLASRIDDTQAWSAAVHWIGDTLVQSTSSGASCVDATVAAVDADGAAVVLSAFQAWATTALAESTTTVQLVDGNQVAIRACDPGVELTAAIAPKVPVVFGGAGVERALVQATVNPATQVKVDASCLITAARLRGTVLTSPADDAPVLAINWQSAYVTANLDLAGGCIAVAG